jgi:hypothetical protein
LNQLLSQVFSVILRVALLLAAVVFVASLLLVAGLVLSVWLVRAFWARLTGKPVAPWTFQVNRQAMWGKFYPQGRSGGSTPHDDSNVIDVEPKQIK